VILLLYIGCGGFFGAILRYLIAGFVQKASPWFPYGTLVVNVLGSFLIGFLAMLFMDIIAPHWKAFFITGFLGALTTFSTFSYETTIMLQEGLVLKAMLNVLSNVTFSIIATMAGMVVYRLIGGGI
jgi:CrcB protein